MQNRSFRHPLMLITNNQEGWKPAIIVFNILMKMNNRTMERKVGTKVQKLKMNFIKVLTPLCFDLSSKLVCLWLWRIHTVAVLTFTSVCPSCFSSTIHSGCKGQENHIGCYKEWDWKVFSSPTIWSPLWLMLGRGPFKHYVSMF